MKKLGKLLVQITLAFALLLMFFIWAPWFAAKPISQLDGIGIPHGPIPPGARSFNVNHGKVHFRESGVVAEEPIRFGALTITMLLDFYLLVISFPKGQRGIRRLKEQPGVTH